MGKQNLCEHSQRIPLIVAGPGVTRGEVSDGLVWHGDTSATIRALAGLPRDPDAEGASLVGPDGVVPAPREHHGAAYELTQRSFRDGRHKLIVYRAAPTGVMRPGSTPGEPMVQLFDLEADSWELENLAGRPEVAGIQARLTEGLRAWQLSVGDPLPGFATA